MNKEEIIERAISGLESAANFMRGALLDPALPQHFKEAMRSKLEDLDAEASELADEFMSL